MYGTKSDVLSQIKDEGSSKCREGFPIGAPQTANATETLRLAVSSPFFIEARKLDRLAINIPFVHVNFSRVLKHDQQVIQELPRCLRNSENVVFISVYSSYIVYYDYSL